VEFGFVYRLTLRERANPPGRHRDLSDTIRNWFKSNGVRYGMGSLGGSRVIYGTVDGCSEQELHQHRVGFIARLSRLPVCADVNLGRTKPAGSVNLMESDWERTFEIDNLTEADRAAALTYHTELAEWAEAHAKTSAEGS
jgi:hypothetical protein